MKIDPEIHRPLSHLLLDLRAATDLVVDADELDGWTARRAHAAVLDGKLPAVMVNGRWYYLHADRKRIAALMGLMPKPRIGRPPLHRTSAPSNTAAAAQAA